MKVYLQNIELNFDNFSSANQADFDHTIPEGNETAIKSFSGSVYYVSGNFDSIAKVLDVLQEKIPRNLASVTFPVSDKEKIKEFLKNRYTYIKAAGGLVVKEGNYLFIYRLKKWDLPKGKLEKGEDMKECAIREVEEECSIKVAAKAKIGNTWHIYPVKSGWCVKKSTWYLMKCLDDSEMKPQTQEDIEDIAWIAPDSAPKYLANSYGTIRDVFFKARKKGLI